MNKIYIVTLGCSKNDVDTTLMYSILDRDKYVITNNVNEADIIIINTCGFIAAAKEESIDTILECVEYKKNGICKKILLSGCMAQRYPEELLKEIPEVDGIIGTGNISYINELLDSTLAGNKVIKTDNLNSDYIEGIRKKNVQVTEYVKISEGCNNNCSYCIIPQLRGINRSRKIEDIFDEVMYLVQNGTREIILIAQNTTDYGIDLYSKFSLPKLIKELSKIEDLKWIRILYLYPDHFDDELINEFVNNDKLLKYVDIPLQHVSNNILNKMNRKTNKNDIVNLINKLRAKVKDIIIRTTFIVGFPGETEEDFNELVEFIKSFEFDKLGVFAYSREEDTPASSLSAQIDENIKELRRNKIMQEQSLISAKRLESLRDKTFETIVEEKIDKNTYSGRTYMDAPEIDGIVYINSNIALENGEFVQVKIKDSLNYDLIGDAK